MSLDLIFALIFYIGILIFFFTHKKEFEIQNKIILLYRTKIGLKLMDKVSKIFPKFLKLIGLIGVFVGFLGMIFIFGWLIKSFVNLIIFPNSITWNKNTWFFSIHTFLVWNYFDFNSCYSA